jgi:hypothetical protein
MQHAIVIQFWCCLALFECKPKPLAVPGKATALELESDMLNLNEGIAIKFPMLGVFAE